MAAPNMTISPSPPVGPAVGDLWYNNVSGFLFIWYDDGTTIQWVVANPGIGSDVGAPGLQGPEGPAGATGAVGPQGPSGPPGPPDPNDLVKPIVTDNVASQALLMTGYPAVVMKGWDTVSDGGGGLLMLDPASVKTVDNALVFPAVIGRYTRPVDGILHTRFFGIKSSTTLDQSAKLQAFFDELVNHGVTEPFYRGFIDPDTIDCGGKTLYLRRTDSPNVGVGVQIDGASRGFSVLQNLHLSIGSVADFPSGDPPLPNGFASVGGASQIKMSNFIIKGLVDFWTVEISSKLDWMVIQAPPLPVTRTYTSPIDGLPDPSVLASWPDLDDYIVNIVQSNHMHLDSSYVSDATASTEPPPIGRRNGINLNVSVNTLFTSGGVTGTVKGVVMNGGGATTFHRFKSEGVRQETIWNKRHSSCYIEVYARSGFEHQHGNVDPPDNKFPVIRIGGDSGIDAPTNTTLKNCFFISDNPAALVGSHPLVPVAPVDSVCIEVRRGDGVFIDSCTFTGSGFFGGWQDAIRSMGTDTSLRLDVGPNNWFDPGQNVGVPPDPVVFYPCVVNPVTMNLTTNFAEQPKVFYLPRGLAQLGATTSWEATRGRVRSVNLLNTAAWTLSNPTGFTVGRSYRLIVTKATNNGNFTTWGTMYKFPGGTPPPLAAMLSTEYMTIDFDCLDFAPGGVPTPLFYGTYVVRTR